MNEFSHLVAHDAIGRSGAIAASADEAQRAAIAARLGLVSVVRFDVGAELAPTAEGARLTGTVAAEVVQSCAATGLPVPASVTAPFALRYVTALEVPGDAEEEIELGDEDLDTMAFEPGGVDVGEAAVQTLALALDPFPRHADADAILRQRGVLSEGQAGPFAALAALKK